VIVDAHHHFWNPAREALPWMTAEHSAIARAFEPADLAPLLARAGVASTVLVQSACTDADTDSMFAHAARHEWIGAVIAWVDLRSPERARRRLTELAGQPKLRGVRHLIHDEPDPRWILREDVRAGLALLEERRLILELPCVYPRHLADVPVLAARYPGMTIVIDHLAKPPLRTAAMDSWAAELRDAAVHGNVVAKISGLNTVLPPGDWGAEDLHSAIEVAFDAFGPERLLCGSDWPVALLNGDYETVWRETIRAVEAVAPEHVEQLLAGTARRLYTLDTATAPAEDSP